MFQLNWNRRGFLIFLKAVAESVSTFVFTMGCLNSPRRRFVSNVSGDGNITESEIDQGSGNVSLFGSSLPVKVVNGTNRNYRQFALQSNN